MVVQAEKYRTTTSEMKVANTDYLAGWAVQANSRDCPQWVWRPDC